MGLNSRVPETKKEKFEAGNDFSDYESSNVNTIQSLRGSKLNKYADSSVEESEGSNQPHNRGIPSSKTKKKKDKQINEILLNKALGVTQPQAKPSSKFKQNASNNAHTSKGQQKVKGKSKFIRNEKSHSTASNSTKRKQPRLEDGVTQAYLQFVKKTKKRNSGLNPMQYSHDEPDQGKLLP